MPKRAATRRIWGWMFFDWASQPYNTLLLTFIFSPYFATVVGDPTRAQVLWGHMLTASGVIIAILAPILGAFADNTGRRMPWIVLFSLCYIVGSAGLWWATPHTTHLLAVLASFAVGLIGMEFATIFTNSLLPSLGPRHELGRISGSGWAFGYVGGVVSLALMLLFLAENDKGVTLIGIPPILGLDPASREGTRSVGPLTAIWYFVFMVPFFLWVKERHRIRKTGTGARAALGGLWRTIRNLPRRPSLSAYLVSSMFYRDALNGMYTFGGIYALGVLHWSVIDVGVFGILAAITGAVFTWIGGRADRAFGPKPVITSCIVILLLVAIAIPGIARDGLMGIAVAAGSRLPDIAFYLCGALIGAAGGALQSASRTMLVHQANPDRMTEAFGLYALSGKATAFIAPAAIAAVTASSGSQRIGVTPLIALFLTGLILMLRVRPDGEGPPA